DIQSQMIFLEDYIDYIMPAKHNIDRRDDNNLFFVDTKIVHDLISLNTKYRSNLISLNQYVEHLNDAYNKYERLSMSLFKIENDLLIEQKSLDNNHKIVENQRNSDNNDLLSLTNLRLQTEQIQINCQQLEKKLIGYENIQLQLQNLSEDHQNNRQLFNCKSLIDKFDVLHKIVCQLRQSTINQEETYNIQRQRLTIVQLTMLQQQQIQEYKLTINDHLKDQENKDHQQKLIESNVLNENIFQTKFEQYEKIFNNLWIQIEECKEELQKSIEQYNIKNHDNLKQREFLKLKQGIDQIRGIKEQKANYLRDGLKYYNYLRENMATLTQQINSCDEQMNRLQGDCSNSFKRTEPMYNEIHTLSRDIEEKYLISDNGALRELNHKIQNVSGLVQDNVKYLSEIQDEKQKRDHLLEQLTTWMENKQIRFNQLNDRNYDENTIIERMNRIEFELNTIKEGYSILKNVQNIQEHLRGILDENDVQTIDELIGQCQQQLHLIENSHIDTLKSMKQIQTSWSKLTDSCTEAQQSLENNRLLFEKISNKQSVTPENIQKQLQILE
ncbi:unnamed protein product, partial [Didymodactylos carnosus]